jgi:hypothetical protein
MYNCLIKGQKKKRENMISSSNSKCPLAVEFGTDKAVYSSTPNGTDSGESFSIF